MNDDYRNRNDRDQGRSNYGRPDQAQSDSSNYSRRETSHEDRGNGYGTERDYGRPSVGDDRGFADRAGDEVRSWFGDEDAERRRREDARMGGQDSYPSNQGPRSQRSDYDRDRSRVGSGRDEDRGFMDRAAGWLGGDDANRSGSDRDHSRRDINDHGYDNWRQRQIAALDRDYDEYRREHQSKFDSEFHGWRTNRQSQRDSLNQVQEHFEVVGSDGAHVGKVDKIRGDRIILAKNDPDAGGHHHSIPSSWLQSVDGEKVMIAKTAAEAKRAWRDEDANQAMFEGQDRHGSNRQDQSNDGPHVLNRSFSGTY